jgi:hypothetical protein
MLANLLTAISLIFLLLLGWIVVQHLARAFAARHSELGPAREEGGGCSLICLCRDAGKCPKKRLLKALKTRARKESS